MTTNLPNGLVGDNYVVPVWDDVCHGLELMCDHVDRLVLLTLLCPFSTYSKLSLPPGSYLKRLTAT